MKLWIIFFTIAFSQISNAQILPDYAKESRWATQVEDGLMDGEIVWINADKHKFMAIYTPSEIATVKTAIIVHGLGVHPDWQQVIQPLRVALTENNFNTLSIQMPVLKNNAKSSDYQHLFKDASLRIIASVKYLKKQDLTANILVAHSLGSVMSAYHLANNTTAFKKFIAIGMSKSGAKYLSKINIEVFDLYGKDDIDSVLSSVNLRKKYGQHNKKYQQKMVASNHFFNDKDDLLIKTVVDWLQ